MSATLTSVQPNRLALPDLVGHREVSAMLGCKHPSVARRLLAGLGVPIVRATERVWFVRRDLLLQALGSTTIKAP
jgi:hypothetical protein